MRKNFVKFVNRYGTQICAIAVMAAGISSRGCRVIFYQPEEPEGLEAFAKKM